MDNIASTASKTWNSMPTWGQGALIGGGIGALGGMLSDKKKMRGALQGALLGGGLGAAGGYAYSQMNPQSPTVDPAKIPKLQPAAAGNTASASPAAAMIGGPIGARLGANPAQVEEPSLASKITEGVKDTANTVKSVGGDALDFAKSIAGTQVGIGALMAGAGRYLTNTGLKNTSVVGGPSPKGPYTSTVDVAPSAKMTMESLKYNPQELGNVLTDIAGSTKKSPYANLVRNLTPDNNQMQLNQETLKQMGPYTRAQRLYDATLGKLLPNKIPMQVGAMDINEPLMVTRPQLVAAQNARLAGTEAKSPLRAQDAVERGLAGRRWGGRALTGAGLATAGAGVLNSLKSMAKNTNSTGLPAMPDTQDSWNALAQRLAGQPNAVDLAQQYAQANNWSTVAQQYIKDLLTGAR
jgi:hypothetical protein